MDEKRFPKYIHKPLIVFIFLEVDDMLVGGMFYMLALALENGWFIFGVPIAPMVFRYVRDKFHRGFLMHILYYLGLKDFDGYPSAYETSFQE